MIEMVKNAAVAIQKWGAANPFVQNILYIIVIGVTVVIVVRGCNIHSISKDAIIMGDEEKPKPKRRIFRKKDAVK